MNDFERMLCLAGLKKAEDETRKPQKNIIEVLDTAIGLENKKTDLAISSGRKLLKELNTIQPIKKAPSRIMESSASSEKDKQLLIRLIKESVKYSDKESVKAQIATKMSELAEKYNLSSIHDLIIKFDGTIMQDRNGITVKWK